MDLFEMKGWKIIGHPADIAMEVSGNSHADLLINASQGWKNVVCGFNRKGNETKKFSFSGKLFESVIVEFLGELNYLLTVKNWCFDKIENLEINKTGSGFEAIISVSGSTFNESAGFIKEEIKAVTYHQMNIELRNGIYSTLIIFDV